MCKPPCRLERTQILSETLPHMAGPVTKYLRNHTLNLEVKYIQAAIISQDCEISLQASTMWKAEATQTRMKINQCKQFTLTSFIIVTFQVPSFAVVQRFDTSAPKSSSNNKTRVVLNTISRPILYYLQHSAHMITNPLKLTRFIIIDRKSALICGGSMLLSILETHCF
jgi:hypothetical protein